MTFISHEFFLMILSMSHSYWVSNKLAKVYPFFLEMKVYPASKMWVF